MTGRGIVLSLTFLLSLFWALVTGSREVWLVALLTGALLLVSLTQVLPAALCLHGQPRLSDEQVTRGGMAAYVIDWSGRLLLPVYVRVTVADPCAGDFRGLDPNAGRICAQRFIRPWKNAVPMRIRVSTRHRGMWTVTAEKIRVRDVFGFFSLPLRRAGDKAAWRRTMTVYPLLHELAGEPSAWSESTEYNESRMVTADYGESFAGTRPYRDGDSLKRIHWKQTIRPRELHTRQYEQASDTEVTILLDDQAPAIFLPGYADLATECAAALAHFYLEHACRVKLLDTRPGGIALECSGAEAFAPLYTQLAEVPFLPAAAPLDRLPFPYRTVQEARMIVAITSRPSGALLAQLNAHAATGCRTVCILPPEAAYALPPADDFPRVQRVLISRPEDVRAGLEACV
ncbi:MAG: DUF58 domain-containing protein [Acutalibacteraceae bacterium]